VSFINTDRPRQMMPTWGREIAAEVIGNTASVIALGSPFTNRSKGTCSGFETSVRSKAAIAASWESVSAISSRPVSSSALRNGSTSNRCRRKLR